MTILRTAISIWRAIIIQDPESFRCLSLEMHVNECQLINNIYKYM